jgi:ABC-type dipeptide/oligopeptide/nickel transport system permease subunit
VRFLFYVAVFAPVICSGLPLLWRGPEGGLASPWLAKVFDRLYWPNEVDRFFNLLMFTTVAWWIVRLVLRLMLADPYRRGHVRRRALAWYGGVLLLLGVAQALGAPVLSSSHPYVDYHEQIEHQHAELARVKAEIPLATKPDARKHLEARRAALRRCEAVFTLVPFGHREQSAKGTVDRFRGPWQSSSRGFHVLGTDELGKDVLALLLYGTRISLTVGILAVSIYVTIGMIVGGIAGYVGGKTDLVIMRIIEIVLSVPGLFLILTIIALFDQRSIFMIMIAIGIVGWTGIARLVRGEFIRERGKDYVAAARSLGLSGPRILFRHIMPNAVAPVIVSATFGVAAAIIVESTLSFLGLGDTNVPSWGQMLNVGRENQEWHMIAASGLAIFVTVTLLNLVGDGLRDALDPRLRK